MAKMMTTNVAFELIKKGDLKLDKMCTVRPETWQRWHGPQAGSTMFLSPGEQVSVENLLHGIVTLSGNDASVVLAECIAGTEEAFANVMNENARRLGLTNSRFGNSNGWPDEGRTYVTARDLAILARAEAENHPDLYKKFYSQTQFTWGKTMGSGANITQANRNPLLDEGIGADGLKTGHTEESGFGLVGSAKSGTQRLIVVMNGLKSMSEREAESRKLLEWGFRSFRQITPFEDGEAVAEADVYGGAKGSVPLKAQGPLRVLVSRTASEPLRARVVYKGPLVAPVSPGVQVGSFQVLQGERVIQETPLYTAEAVEKGSLHQRALDAVGELLFGWIPS